MDPRLVSERLLAPALLLPQAAQISTEALTDIHGGLRARLSPIDLQTMSDIRVDFLRSASLCGSSLGSGLVDHSQKMTVAARAMAEKKAVGQRS